jgi:uncharacterized phage protein (TIGR01671 family)
MSEIKFCGRRLDNSELVYGSLIDDDVTGKSFIVLSVEESQNVNEEGCLRCCTCEVDEQTVGQYTGKHDNKRTTEFPKGQEVYQGDIVKVEYLDNGELQQEIIEVSLSEDGQGYSPFNWEYSCDGCDCGLSIESVEVIGNIYKNPELLEEN